jgi:hypothetical protein
LRFRSRGSKGSIFSIGSKGWGFRKVGSAFSYFLFLVSYSLFPCVITPLRALRKTKNFQAVGNSRLPMLGFFTNHQSRKSFIGTNSTSLFFIFKFLFVI